MDNGLPPLFGGTYAHGAGLQEGLTMRGRSALARNAERMGVPREALRTPTQPPEPASFIGGALTAGQQMVSDALTGYADIARAEDAWVPLPEALIGALDYAGEALEPTQEAQDALAQRYQQRQQAVAQGEMGETEALARDVADGAAAGVAQLGPQIAAFAGGARVGALAGSMFGPGGSIAGGLLGGIGAAALSYYPIARQEAEATAKESGLDPADPAVRDQIDTSTFWKTLISTGGPFAMLARVKPQAASDIFRRALGARTAAKGMVKGALGEAASEVSEMAVDAIMLDPELRGHLASGEWPEALAHAQERYGRDALVAALSAAGAGGTTGTATEVSGQALANARLKEDARKLAETMQPLGLGSEDILALTKTAEGAQKVRAAAQEIGRSEATRRRALAELPKAKDAVVFPEGPDKPVPLLNEEEYGIFERGIVDDADAVIDRHAKALGAPMTTADVRRRRVDEENQRREQLTAQLKPFDLPTKPRRDLDPGVLQTQVANLARTRDAVDKLRSRLEVLADPGRREQTQLELNDAELAHREARIQAAMKTAATPLTRAEATREIDNQVRRERQRGAREAAVQKQLETEFPPDLKPELAQARAQELVDRYEAREPDAAERGLRRKITRLEHQRLRATKPETIDRLTNEIADLAARRGLPPPAVEAARRVLQASGPLPQAEAEASGPEPEQPELAAARTSKAAASDEIPAAHDDGQVQDGAEAAGEFAPASAPEPARPPRRAGSPAIAREFPGLRPKDRPRLAREARTAIADEAQMPAFAETARRAGLVSETAPPEAAAAVAQRLVAADDADQAIAEQAESEAALIPPEDPRLAGWNYDDRKFTWQPLFDVTGVEPTLEELHERLRAWTAESGKEAGAIVAADGTLLGVGTNRLYEGVFPPKNGYGDPTATYVHTHTEQLPFSVSDVRGMVVEHGGPYQAILPDGQVIEMRPKKRVSKARISEMNRLVDGAVLRQLKGADDTTRAFVRQEALLRHLVNEGVIDYVTPIETTQEQRDMIYGVLDATRDAAGSLLRADADGRDAAAGARQNGRRAGTERARLPEGGTSAETRALRKQRNAADPARINELADRIWTDIQAHLANRPRGAPTNLVRAITANDLTQEGVRRAVGVAARGIGNKRGFVIRDMLLEMYPDFLTNPDNFEKAEGARYENRGGVTGARKKIKAEHYRKVGSAIWILNLVNEQGHGFFYPTKRWVKRSRSNQRITPQHHHASSELQEFLNFAGMPGEALVPPLDNPDDTSQSRKHRDSRMTDAQMEPARRTIRYFQRNYYTIDKKALAALEPQDILSKGTLAEADISLKEDLPRLQAILAKLGDDADTGRAARRKAKEVLSPSDNAWMNAVGYKFQGMLDEAGMKLERLRAALARFEQDHPGEPVGFLYQVDRKGRVYADGELNPQSGKKLKAVFRHRDTGVSLADMATVDASASGWQIAAIFARDASLAPKINLEAGLGTTPGTPKRDFYQYTIDALRGRVEAAAADPAHEHHARAKIAMERLFEPGFFKRDMIKTPIIAVNYAAGEANFINHFKRVLKPGLIGMPWREQNALAEWLGREARGALGDVAPHTMAIQDWAIETISKVARAVEDNDPSNKRAEATWTVGLDATYARKKMKRFTALLRARGARTRQYVPDPTDTTGLRLARDEKGDPIPTGKTKEDHNEEEVTIELPRVDDRGIGRSVYSQIIQGFDASILHRAVERYKQATDGAFVTTNHDAFTVPREHQGAMAEAVRESMHEIMSQVDVPQRIYDEAVANLARIGKTPEQVGITPPPPKGDYNIDDVLTSSPVFLEDEGVDPETGKTFDISPPYTILPQEGRELSRARDLPEPELSRFRDVDVANYMAQYEATAGTVAAVREVVLNPGLAARSWGQWIEDKGFNAFAPIRRLERAVKGTIPEGMDSAFKAAEIAVNDSGRNEALLFYGAPAWDRNGAFSVKPGTLGLRDIWRLAGGEGADRGQRLQHWFEYMVARRALQLHEEGVKTPLTDADIKAALDRGADNPQFEQAAEAWKQFNDATLDFLEASGRISEAQKAAMQADEFYVPFYRSEQRTDGTSPDLAFPPGYTPRGPNRSSGLLARDPGIMAIKGGDRRRIDHMMQNMIRNAQAMTAAAMRNTAANKSFELMQQAGLADLVDGKIKKPEGAVAMWRGGDEFWLVPRGPEATPYVLALAALSPMQRSWLGQAAVDVGSIFRQSITLTPPFIIRNWIRGAVSTGLLTSASNMALASNTFTGVRDAWRNSDATKAFKAQSGMGDYRFGTPDIGLGKNDLLMEFGLAPKTRGYYWRQILGQLERAGTATELGDRVAAMKTLMANGVRQDEAAYQALTIMNYNRRGGSEILRALLPMVPFLNARLQGYLRLAEGAIGRTGQKGSRKAALGRLALNGGLLWIASTALHAYVLSDDEDREKYLAEPLHRRLNYHILYVGDTTVLIPKAFELGYLFSSLPELLLTAWQTEEETLGDVGSGVFKMLADTVAFNAIPQAFMPVLEVATNYDFFRQAPIEGLRESQLLPEDRITGASALATFIGRDLGLSGLTTWVNSLVSKESRGISPVVLDHLLEGYGGIAYGMATTAFAIAGAEFGLAPKQVEEPFGTMPVISPALRQTLGWAFKETDLQSSKFVEEYYATAERVTQIVQSARRARQDADAEYGARRAADLIGQHPWAPRAAEIVNKARRKMGELNTAIRTVQQSSSMSREAKHARLRPLYRARNQLARGVVEAVEKLETDAEAE
jgi:hypothetical protein